MFMGSILVVEFSSFDRLMSFFGIENESQVPKGKISKCIKLDKKASCWARFC